MVASVHIELDSRRRASLGKLARKDQSHYVGHVEPDGTIVLVPVDLVPINVVSR